MRVCAQLGREGLGWGQVPFKEENGGTGAPPSSSGPTCAAWQVEGFSAQLATEPGCWVPESMLRPWKVGLQAARPISRVTEQNTLPPAGPRTARSAPLGPTTAAGGRGLEAWKGSACACVWTCVPGY